MTTRPATPHPTETAPTPTPVTDALYAHSYLQGIAIEELWNHARRLEAQALESNTEWARRWSGLMSDRKRLVEALRRITSRATHHGLTLTLHKINLDELRALLRSLGEIE
jgi:hypothetical protein